MRTINLQDPNTMIFHSVLAEEGWIWRPVNEGARYYVEDLDDEDGFEILSNHGAEDLKGLRLTIVLDDPHKVPE